MKTKNNVQKQKSIFLKTAAVVVSFVLISFTVSAQDFWKKLLTNSSFNEIASAMVETPGSTDEPKTAAENFNFALLQNETEATLELESWMTNEANFLTPFEINEVEADLELEKWMLEESLFQSHENNEKPLELEAWMTSEKVWNI